ncbi:MAG: carbamoyltransferase C-terminal domain-containing protein, partial [Elusimicrobia bacterium]|nr:carbamoyltransferase C-terminal domain-containing protein [Elusimicrobiota bacterium]
REVTGARNLVMAGGCALNCVANGLIARERIFDRLFIQPAAGDAGGALGAALLTWHEYLGRPRVPAVPDAQKGSYLGPRYSNEAIAEVLQGFGAKATLYSDAELPARVAELIAAQKVVGLFGGRMEFGPRALGARSIVGDARSPKMQSQMNLKIKFRESFRPFAPSVLAERASEYFDGEADSPYMLLVAAVKDQKRLPSDERMKGLFGIDKLNVPRSVVPAITHVDYSARLQTVSDRTNPRYHRIIKAFHDRTQCPVIINTSFNIRGEPIVCRPEEAYRCFMFTEMDALVLENYVLLKEDQPPLPGAEEHKKRFKLD